MPEYSKWKSFKVVTDGLQERQRVVRDISAPGHGGCSAALREQARSHEELRRGKRSAEMQTLRGEARHAGLLEMEDFKVVSEDLQEHQGVVRDISAQVMGAAVQPFATVRRHDK